MSPQYPYFDRKFSKLPTSNQNVPNAPALHTARLPIQPLPPGPLQYHLCLFCDSKQMASKFLAQINSEMNYYRAHTPCLLPALRLVIHIVDLADLDVAAMETNCARDEFVKAQLDIIYDVDKIKLAIATGNHAQVLAKKLKQAASDRSDRGARFLLLEDVLDPAAGLSTTRMSPAAKQRAYQQAIVEHICRET